MSSGSDLITGAELLLRQQRRGPLVTQVPLLDRLEEGGLPRGSLIELSGRGSTGRFTLALAAISAATRMGESAAMIDLGDHLDPQGASAAGAELPRLLWVRPHSVKEAMTAAEMVLAAGFSFVVLDFTQAPAEALRRNVDQAFPRGARAQCGDDGFCFRSNDGIGRRSGRPGRARKAGLDRARERPKASSGTRGRSDRAAAQGSAAGALGRDLPSDRKEPARCLGGSCVF
ncbi:MAG: hypothetical protein MPW14_26035 (plasmid) [Candidatus Manganitrophus sp.]|nr:MAG: hypothetical protein MPW14_26035 [Candidatus Manganitrophus sp.]